MPNPIRQLFPCLSFPALASRPAPNPNPLEEGHSMQAGPSERRIPPRNFWQTALAKMTPPQKNKKEYLSEWNAWAEQLAPDENRKAALERMKAAKSNLVLIGLGLTSLPENLPASLKTLHSSHNQLTRLPENLPATLETLDSSHNQLTRLPENLPASLKTLDSSHNQLTRLPENLPASLKTLHSFDNQLTSLPENLPASLEFLDSFHNQLTSLPENLPASLKTLDFSHNQLTSLPESISNLLGLHRLDLSNNRFTTVPNALLDLPDTTEVFLRGNPIPRDEIRRVRAELENRRTQGRPVPQLILPEIEDDVNPDNALRDAAQVDFNVHARGLTTNITRRLNVLAERFPDYLVGDTASQRTEMREIQERLQQALNDHGKEHPQRENAQRMAEQMFATGLGERNDFYNDFQGTTSKSAGHVLSYVFLALEEQWKKTPAAHLQEARTNGITQLIDRLASGEGHCDTRLIEEVFQIVGMPFSKYAQSHPEVITDAPISLSREQVRDVMLPLAKTILKQVMQQPDAGEDEKQAFHAALLEEMSKHPAITRDQWESYLNEEIFMDWETFKEVANAE